MTFSPSYKACQHVELFRLEPAAFKEFMLADQQLLNSWIGGYQTEVSLGTVGGHHIVWQAPSRCTPRNLFDDGRAIVTEANGQVCFLRIYSGNQPVTVLELEKIVA